MALILRRADAVTSPFGEHRQLVQWQQRRFRFWRKPSQKALAAAEAAVATILTAPGVGASDRTEYTRLLPCPPTPRAVRIEHLLVEKKGALVNIIGASLKLPTEYVTDLVAFGAVHQALRCPGPPANTSQKQMALFRKAAPKKWPQIKTMSLKEAQRASRVMDPNETVEPGSYIRVHVHPKRSPRCYEVDWLARIIADRESFVVLNKPAGVSVAGTVDNIEETCATFTAKALGLPKPLIATHQLDNCTEGCLVLAKDNEFASRFHKLLRDREVEKYYLALATAPVATGHVSHYMRDDRYPPRIISKEERPRWQLCVMEVLECKQAPWPSETVLSKFHIQSCSENKSEHAYECKVKLLTGQTHQLRAQFSALGSPLIGDTMYMPAVVARSKCPDIDPFLEASTSRSAEQLKELEKKWISLHGPEPELCIGLQSSDISWQEEAEIYNFNAGIPWWRASDELADLSLASG